MALQFRRSANYFNNLVKIANANARLEMRVREELYKENFEALRGKELQVLFKYIEKSANQGAVRIMNWELSTPAHIRKLLFDDQEIQKYMAANGFVYSTGPDCIEWWQAEEEKPVPIRLA